tara:strand:+ start:271 stop:1074 length:804 start_codon:yes stop_codon:yes gene_type:complete
MLIITFVISILGITKVISIEKTYLKPLFFALLIEISGAVIGLYKTTNFFNEEPTKVDSINFKKNDVVLEFNFSKEDWLAVGHYSVVKSRNKEAISAYTKYIEKDKHNFEPYYGIGLAFLNSKKYEKGYEAFKNATEIRKEAASYMNAGICLKNLKRYDDAIIYYEKAISINPEISKLYYNYGTLYQEKGDEQKVIIYMEKAVQKNSQYTKAWYELTKAYYNIGDRENFLRALKMTHNLQKELLIDFETKFSKYSDDLVVKEIMEINT